MGSRRSGCRLPSGNVLVVQQAKDTRTTASIPATCCPQKLRRGETNKRPPRIPPKRNFSGSSWQPKRPKIFFGLSCVSFRFVIPSPPSLFPVSPDLRPPSPSSNLAYKIRYQIENGPSPAIPALASPPFFLPSPRKEKDRVKV